MAFIVRDNEIVAIPIQPGKRVKIGCAYEPPKPEPWPMEQQYDEL